MCMGVTSQTRTQPGAKPVPGMQVQVNDQEWDKAPMDIPIHRYIRWVEVMVMVHVQSQMLEVLDTVELGQMALEMVGHVE